MELIIRPCRIGDLVLLEAALPTGRARLHHERFAAQQQGEATYLVTWLEGRPVGHLMVRWGGSVHDHVRQHFPGVPEIGRLVVAPDHRGRGIGSHLLAHAEALVASRGIGSIGLAVGVRNAGAVRLYARSGYEDWTRGTFPSQFLVTNQDGEIEAHPHDVTYLFKRLQPSVGLHRNARSTIAACA